MGIIYRNELKFICNEKQMAVIFSRLSNIMKLDKNTNDSNCYNVRSLYLDTYHSSFFYDNEYGISDRVKYRVRIYDAKKDVIRLEIKEKTGHLARKESCVLSELQFLPVLYGQSLKKDLDMPKPYINTYLQMQTNLLRRNIIVDYTRTALVEKHGNVRITFDRDISSSRDFAHFFDKHISSIPVLPQGMSVLEVKYDEFIPDHISAALETKKLTLSPFSKYYYCCNSNKLSLLQTF